MARGRVIIPQSIQAELSLSDPQILKEERGVARRGEFNFVRCLGFPLVAVVHGTPPWTAGYGGRLSAGAAFLAGRRGYEWGLEQASGWNQASAGKHHHVQVCGTGSRARENLSQNTF